jgi:hypothetical protein
MFNSDTAAATASPYMPSLETAARSLKVELIIAPVHSDAHRAPIISAAARNNVPAVSATPTFARDGGLRPKASPAGFQARLDFATSDGDPVPLQPAPR